MDGKRCVNTTVVLQMCTNITNCSLFKLIPHSDFFGSCIYPQSITICISKYCTRWSGRSCMLRMSVKCNNLTHQLTFSSSFWIDNVTKSKYLRKYRLNYPLALFCAISDVFVCHFDTLSISLTHWQGWGGSRNNTTDNVNPYEANIPHYPSTKGKQCDSFLKD